MKYREAHDLEIKEKYTDSFLKTVSAFSNFCDGKIIFGVNNSGEIVGIQNVDENRLKIEHAINDTIKPSPNYNIEIKAVADKEIVILNVYKGKYTPYMFKDKAYMRMDTSSKTVDRNTLKNLIMIGENLSYEDKKVSGDFSFDYLESKLQEKIGIEKLDLDVLKTLNLYSIDGEYNFAAKILSDKFESENIGIDLARFGDNINKILFRKTIKNISILEQYYTVINYFKEYYEYEEIVGEEREKKELISLEAFREALANAIVHRDLSINAMIQISFFDNRIEINSPGGLPNDITEEEYLNGRISRPRNPIISGVFYRLGIIERFGTGIGRIKYEYEKSVSKPIFDISSNNIEITLPVIGNFKTNISSDEAKVLELLYRNDEMKRSEIDTGLDFNKSKTIRVLQSLIDMDLIVKVGEGVATKYKIVR